MSNILKDVHTSFMDVTFQYNNPPNPADAAIGPQAYDHHVYYSYVNFRSSFEYLDLN